ncbi:TnpV protein [[Clostridium] scindens]|uniref:TnpV protein n=1 Tax=Clostridium scindens (strain JCM 10418 / VPI 12708) TaxID=29347 RepID=UPI001D07BF3F|nr:TnpV protein [[Clostridium] scindens]MCB6647438.1 TnpV protein [[Clostridium] scindens]
MNLNNLSAKKICRLVSAGMVFSMLVITGIFGGIMQDIRIFIVGGTLTLCAFFWIWLLVLIFGKRLSHFTSNLCRTLDNMIDGNEELQKSNDSETLFARINHRLIRLYEIMQKNRHKVDMERQELQMLISDISHQVKTPVSNLQMVTDTLLTKPVSEEERMDFLQGIRSQTDKLDFLFQALVKTSRLETGAIRLEKKDSSLPELALTDIEPTYGKYGMLRKSYLQEHRKAKYQILLLQGKLVEHLNQIDAEARDREEQLVKQMMEKEGITEELKRQDNMEWTRRMNTLCHDAEEMILTEMIYTKG